MIRVSGTLQILVMALAIIAVTMTARRWRYPEPLVLVAVGVGLSLIPGAFTVRITPGLVIDGLLPPLLYATAIRTPLVQFTRYRRAIALLAVGAVIVSTVGVGLAIWWILPGATLAVALAFGAVVAPPDAVAAVAVARRVGMPRRIVEILEGESLLNDATALVALGTAITAMAARVSAPMVAVDLLWASVGGAGIGLAVAAVLARVLRWVDAPVLATALSFVAPYLAFLPAEQFGASGVLAVVVAGLALGHRSVATLSATARITEMINWNTVAFLLENAVFLLIGLQVTDLVATVGRGSLGWAAVLPVCAVALGATIAVRFGYVFAVTAAQRIRGKAPWTWPEATITSWAGMRGVVTLAAVFVIPPDTPHHAVLALAAFTVVAGTLSLQGLTLPRLVRLFGLRGPDPVEDAVQLAGLTTAATGAGLARLAELAAPSDPPEVLDQLRDRAERRVNMTWERLGRPRTELEPPSAAYRRLRTEMLAAERGWVIASRNSGRYAEEVLQQALMAMDLEESMLDQTGNATERLAEQLAAETPGSGDCGHLREAAQIAVPTTPEGCAECLRDGTRWVHLRLCLDCGHIGCCDSSPGRHATAHFTETGHPVMRSFEPGESWRWCYIDEITG